MRWTALLLSCSLFACAAEPPAPPAPEPPPPVAAPLPELLSFAVTPAVTGSEAALVAEIEALLPVGWHAERDVFGSLIVRSGAADERVRRLIAVGIDEPGYVVSQIRDDGWLGVHFVGRTASPAFHLAHEGRPASVLSRAGAVAGVITVNSVHFRAPRPDPIGEEHLFLDVGADSPADVAALGIELLDPVAAREIVRLADGRVAGPALGARAAVLALLAVLRDLPPARASGLQFAFVAQSLPAPSARMPDSGPLGRGGEAVVRGLAAPMLLLRSNGALDKPMTEPSRQADRQLELTVLELRVANADSPVETVAPGDLKAFTAALAAEVAK